MYYVINMTKKLMKFGFEEKKFDTGKVKLNYVEGPNNGPALLLVPGQISTWESYHKVLPELSRNFHVFTLDIRGHGDSEWTTGHYSWNTVGEDLKLFLDKIVKEPAIVSGNSSGGVLALWLAANAPDLVKGIILEDPPLFSSDMPRFKEEKFTYNNLKSIADYLGDPKHRKWREYFKSQVLPTPDGETKEIPEGFRNWVVGMIEKFEKKHPGEPIDLVWMPPLRLFIKQLSMFDPDFAKSFVDGSFQKGFSHEAALKKVKCPAILVQATWFRSPKLGLAGAMDDKDAKKAREILPELEYKKVDAPHAIHLGKPKLYLDIVEEFTKKLPNSNEK